MTDKQKIKIIPLFLASLFVKNLILSATEELLFSDYAHWKKRLGM